MNLRTILDVLWRQRLVVTAVLLAGFATFLWAQSAMRKYVATATVLAANAGTNDAAALDPQKDPTSAAVTPQDLPNLLTSTHVLSRVAKDMHLTDAEAAKLGGQIKAKLAGSDLLPITFSDRDPKRAVEGANIVTKELVMYDQQIVTQRYDALIRDLNNQLSSRSVGLRKLDARIAALTAQDPYLSVDQGTSAINSRLTALEAQRQQVQATMSGDAAATATAAQRPALAREAANQEIVMNDPKFKALQAQLGNDLAKLYLEKAGYTDRFPGLAGLQGQVNREQTSVARDERAATSSPAKSPLYVGTLLDVNKANAALANDRAQLSAIDGEISDMTSHLQDSRGEGTALAALRRDRLAGDQAYADLSTRLSKAVADRAQAASIDSVIVIDQPQGASLSMLSRPAVLGTALAMASVWLAVTLAFLIDGVDMRLRNRETIEDVYGRPVFHSVG